MRIRPTNRIDVERAREWVESRGGSTDRLSDVRILELAGLRAAEVTRFVTKPCPGCGWTSVLLLSRAGLADWRGGALIQVAFPKDQREQMITGYDQACWDALFAEDER